MRLLFVENHRGFAEVVVDRLLAPHEVVVLPTVAAALGLIEQDLAFDAVLVDYDLDDGKGNDVVRALRAGGYRGLIVAVSAHHDGNTALLRAGADVACPKASFAGIEGVLLAAT